MNYSATSTATFTALLIPFVNLGSYQAKQFAPGRFRHNIVFASNTATTSATAAFESKFLSPNLRHGTFKRVQVFLSKTSNCRVDASQLDQVGNNYNIEEIDIVDSYSHGSHES
jgi:hypothetical protein